MTNSKIGENIRNLRKSYGETQQELGRALNVEFNTISMYESGKRQPDLQTIKAIADRYGFPVDTLIREDFSNINLSFNGLTWDRMISIAEAIFPMVYSVKALEDPHFAKGYEYTTNIWNKIKNIKSTGDELMYSLFERAYKEYVQSLEIFETIESAANLLWLIFVMYSLLPDEHSVKLGEAILYEKALSADFVKNYVIKDANRISRENEENKKSYARDKHESVMIFLQILKKSPDYADLADYYLAMKYIIGMAGNDISDDMNKTIGMEMMISFLTLANPYAFKYVDNCIKL